jgi:uncharacterized tellurite resistance protein B-like protein
MTSLLDWLRGARPVPGDRGDTDTVRRIVGELDKLAPDRARYLAAFAYVLSRVAGADSNFSAVETATMVDLVQKVGRLPEPQATLVVEIAKSQNKMFGGTENFLVTREFRDVTSEGERQDLLHCLFAVASADEKITPEEDAQIWQIAGELGVTHADFVQVRLAYSAQRTALRRENQSS